MNSASIEEKINIIIRQTSMTDREEIEELLKKYNNDYVQIIKNHYEIKTEEPELLPAHQEIYRQIRYKMNTAMKEYVAKQDEDEEGK